MKRNEGMFAIKLYELEKQYGRMQSRLRLCQEEEDHEKILQQLQSMMDEFRENENFCFAFRFFPRQNRRIMCG